VAGGPEVYINDNIITYRTITVTTTTPNNPSSSGVRRRL